MTRATWPAILTFALVLGAGGCTYSGRPLPGAVICGSGQRQCPDGFMCYSGGLGVGCDNTCWPVGAALPTASTVCPARVLVPDAGAPDVALADGARPPVDSAPPADAAPVTDASVDSAPAHDAASDAPAVCNPACGAHARCVSGATGGTCACVAGYQASGGTCVWGTVPLDPGFQNMPANAWTLEQGATINPTTGGNIDPGELDFTKESLCTSRGRARQSITMPSFADSGLFALRVASNGDCTNCTGSGIAVVLNGGANLFAYNSVSTIQLDCLGERAYNGTFDIVVRPSTRVPCPTANTLDAVVDHVSIEPSTTCPMPGTIPDANFDGTVSNWTPSLVLANTPAPLAEVLAGAGTGGSHAGHISIGDNCQQARLNGPISPPLSSIANMALQMSYKGTAGEHMLVEMGGIMLGVLPGSGAQQTAKVCLLETNKGMTQTASMGWSAPSFTPNGIGCGAHPVDFVFDDLQLVSDPSCPATALIADGGFERADTSVAWEGTAFNNGVAGGVSATSIDGTAANAHGGTHSLMLMNGVGCGYAQAWFAVAVPPSAPGAGPALTFFYKAPSATSASVVKMTAGSASLSSNLTTASSYTQAQLASTRPQPARPRRS